MKTLINSAAFGWLFASIVFSGVASYAYYIAHTLHTTGSELIKVFL